MEAEHPGTDSLAWLAPGYWPAPAEAMARIQAVCKLHAALFSALFTVMATHPALPRELLAAALKTCRRDLDALSRDDVASLMAAIHNGGRQGFDAVLRTRRGAPRGASAVSWMGGEG
jgi:hypothetical protein